MGILHGRTEGRSWDMMGLSPGVYSAQGVVDGMLVNFRFVAGR